MLNVDSISSNQGFEVGPPKLVENEINNHPMRLGYGACNVTGCTSTGFTGGWSTCQTSGCAHSFASHT